MITIQTKICSAVIAIVAFNTTIPSAVWAQNQPADPSVEASTDEKAREHYLRGERYYAEGDYELSIQEFRAAYDLSNRPKLLFNLANAYERLSRFELAIEALRTYSATLPEYERNALSKRIQNLETRADEKAKRDEALVALSKQKATEAKVVGTQPQSTILQNGTTTTEQSEVKSSDTLGWAVLGTGVGVIGVGGIMALLARNARNKAEPNCLNDFCVEGAQEFIDDDKRYSLFADIAFGVGTVAAVTGLVFLISGDKNDNEKMSGLRATPTTNGFSVSYSGWY